MTLHCEMIIGNGTLLAKVADFGFAKMADSADTFGLYKSIVGTPLFQAPELFQRSQYDSSVDVFALGLTYLSMIQHTVCRDPLYPRLGKILSFVNTQILPTYPLAMFKRIMHAI